jgi:hypothetical protein
MVRRSSASTYTCLVRGPTSGRDDARPFLLKRRRAVQVDAPLPKSDFILQLQITISKIGTPSDLEGRPSLYAESWRDV